MANIKDKIIQIRKAIFGKEVRDTIASGIEEINNEVESTTNKQNLLETEFDQLIINAGSSNAEIVQARVGQGGSSYSSLKERLDKENEKTESKFEEVDSQLEQKTTHFEELKKQILKDNLGELKLYKFPTEFGWDNAPITIFNDGEHFYTDFDVSNYKNISTNTYYVSPTGNNSNNGLTENTPFLSLQKAHSVAVSGDTIILLDGVYKRPSAMSGTSITKSLNIIAKNSGKVNLINADDHTYTKTSGYTNVYQASRNNVSVVLDISNISKNVTLKLKFVTSLAECDTTEGSWYTDGTLTYVHLYNHRVPTDKNTALILEYKTPFYVECTSENVNLYLEGLNVFGGLYGNVNVENSATYKEPSFYAKDCSFLHGRSLTSDPDHANGVNIIGCKYAFLQNCICAYARKDGFNYHAKNGTIPKVIEVECKAFFNGENVTASGWTNNTYNGSTVHGGTKIIRLKGVYYGNIGTNVADVHVGTRSICLECIGYNSKSTDQTMYNSNFGTQQSDAIMWLENCIAFGSTYDITAMSGTTMNVKNTLYGTKTGGGTFNIS